MLFNTQNFIFLFLPGFILSYYFASKKLRNTIVLIYSILFYTIGNYDKLYNVLILVALIVINYILFQLIIKYKKKNNKCKKYLFVISIVFNVGVICYFKVYSQSNVMPLGMSFYTFHFISLHIDLYKSKNNKYNLKILNYLNYILYFPKILLGPITRYDYFIARLNKKDNVKDSFFIGLYYFVVGLALKCLLSDNINYIINQINVFGFDSISILTAWMGMYCFTMKLYFDFAGYSLMALGIAKIIGMDLPINFDLPFCSKSISEFWRKWHITLGQFFRDYIYIPLGGNFNNKKPFKQSLNLIIVWLVTGLWHGFKINYIIWATIICIFIILEKFYLNGVYMKCSILGRILVNTIIPFTFLIFSIDSLPNIYIYISKLFTISSIYNIRDFKVIFGMYWKTFILGIIFMTKYPKMVMEIIKENKLLMIAITVILILVSVNMINITNNDTFKYLTF